MFPEDAVSTSMKLDRLFNEAPPAYLNQVNQTFEYGNSQSEEPQLSNRAKMPEYNEFKNQPGDLLSTPVKKNSQASEAIQLSSVKVEFRDEGELQSSSGGNNGISNREPSNLNPNSMSNLDGLSKAEVLFNTPQLSDKVVSQQNF